EVLAGFDTRLDTPPISVRHHPVSRIAPYDEVAEGPIPEVASLIDHPVDAGAERRRKFERSAPSIFRAPGDYLFKCRDCKHNGGKDRTCIGDKRAIMCADCAYALPNDHEPRNIATDKHPQSVR
ncbi:hypothetical protein, partial [Bradyrhizobium sp. Leo121]